MSEPDTRPFGEVLAQVLIDHGYKTSLHAPNWSGFAKELPDVSYESLRQAVTGERKPPSVRIMEAVAKKLGIDPTVFWEYQLDQARRQFDPREVGEDQAYANLQKWLAQQPAARRRRKR